MVPIARRERIGPSRRARDRGHISLGEEIAVLAILGGRPDPFGAIGPEVLAEVVEEIGVPSPLLSLQNHSLQSIHQQTVIS